MSGEAKIEVRLILLVETSGGTASYVSTRLDKIERLLLAKPRKSPLGQMGHAMALKYKQNTLKLLHQLKAFRRDKAKYLVGLLIRAKKFSRRAK